MAPGDGSQRMRLITSVLDGHDVIAKYLIVIAQTSYIDRLIEKVQARLQQAHIATNIEYVLNNQKATLKQFLIDALC